MRKINKASPKLFSDIQVNFKCLSVNETNLDIIENYKIGLSYVIITSDGRYLIKDPTIAQNEIETLNNIINDLVYKLPSIQVDDRNKFREVLEKFGIYENKLIYYLERELFGYGVLEPLMKDQKIEDIQIPSPNVPARVVHSDYGKMVTNVILDENELDLYIEKLVYKSGKSVSMFKPMLSIKSSDTARITVTYKKEVGYKGSSVTIRKFPENPWSITRILCKNTIDVVSAAYLMKLIENKKAVLVIGGMGDGKTSLINSLTNFIPHNSTVITVEDSVCGDAYILCILENELKFIKIGELIESLFLMNNKEKEGFLKVDNLYVLTIDENNNINWKKCDYVYKHTVFKEFVKIITESGKEIEVTADHSLFKFDENSKTLIPVKCSLLEVGDTIAVLANLNLEDLILNSNSLAIRCQDPNIISSFKSSSYSGSVNTEFNSAYEILQTNINEAKATRLFEKLIYSGKEAREEILNNLVEEKADNKYKFIRVKSRDEMIAIQTLLLLLGIESIAIKKSKGNDEYYEIIINDHSLIDKIAFYHNYHINKNIKHNCIKNEKIINVEKSFKRETVYDLTVLDTGKFIANNFICHNTPELRLAHQYWIPLVTRESITLDEKGNIDMFSLVKHALRMSGDYLIVGEVRGEEGRVWAQAIMTGHGGITSLHAESPSSAIERLLSDPIKVEAGSLSSLHSIVDIRKVSQYKENSKGKKIVTYHRRVTGLYDLNFSTSTKEAKFYKVTSYDGENDTFKTISLEEIIKLPTMIQIMEEKGIDEKKLLKDLETKVKFLNKVKEIALSNNEYLDYSNICRVIWEFYKDPDTFKFDEIPKRTEIVLE
jgi:Type IV secretory pathway, VirB11 components, and related ATPases involved in archaeal flagella biosynthesis